MALATSAAVAASAVIGDCAFAENEVRVMSVCGPEDYSSDGTGDHMSPRLFLHFQEVWDSNPLLVGEYTIKGLASRPIICGQGDSAIEVTIRNYTPDFPCLMGPNENYQVEVSQHGKVVFRSEMGAGDCSPTAPFLGTMDIRGGSLDICRMRLHSQGTPSPLDPDAPAATLAERADGSTDMPYPLTGSIECGEGYLN